MIGAVPAIFRNLQAAQLVALGYSKETGVDWCIVESVDNSGIYKLVEVGDLTFLSPNEWKPVSKLNELTRK